MNTCERKKTICIVISPSFGMSKCYGDQINYLQENNYEIVFISDDNILHHDNIRKQGINTYKVNFTRLPNLIKDIISLFKLWVIFARKRFDVIQVSTPKASLLGALAARMAGQSNIVYLMRGRPYENYVGLRRKFYQKIDGLTCLLSRYVIPVSVSLKNAILCEKVCGADKIKYVGSGSSNGVDLQKYHMSDAMLKLGKRVRTDLRIPESDTVFLYVGWIRREKGINELIHAYDKIRNMQSGVHLVLVGNMTEYDQIDRSTEIVIDSNESIHCIQWVEDLRPYYAGSDVLILPSWREGFPRVILEAAGFEVPAITTDVVGCRDSIENMKTGLLVNARDEIQLANAMKYMLNNLEKRKIMGRSSRTKVENEYSQERVWREHLDVFNLVVKSKGDK